MDGKENSRRRGGKNEDAALVFDGRRVEGVSSFAGREEEERE